MKRLAKTLRQLGCETLEKFSMSSYTAIKAGGEARLMVCPQNSAALCRVLEVLSTEKVPFKVLGAGSNTIVRDEGVEGVVINTCRIKNFEILPDATVVAECGASLSAVMNKTAKAGLCGLEFAAGIPGTVGGAVFMNSGTKRGEISSVIENVVFWKDGSEHKVEIKDINPRYRHGGLPPGSVLLKAQLRLESGDSEAVCGEIRKSLVWRKRTQPVKQPNTGSVFKNPATVAAGRLLEEIGMKSASVGAAQFSGVHANFIVNNGGAKASDVLKLIEIARREARKQRGIDLETEVCII